MGYKPAEGSTLNEEQAKRYGERIEALIESHGGAVQPAEVVADAKRKRSPLHDYFEWDDTEAAKEYRLDQARHLLRSIHIVVEEVDEGEQTVRAFHNVRHKENDHTASVYVTVQRAMTEDELRAQVIDRALGQLENWRKRYQQYKELAGVFAAIDEALKEVKE